MTDAATGRDPFDLVAEFIQRAEQHGLLVECLTHVLTATERSEPLESRLAQGLYEWDV